MKTQSVERLVSKLEVGIVVVFLLYFMNVEVSPLLTKLLNASSYGFIGLLIAWRWKRFIYVATRDIPLLLLVGTAIASLFWSATPGETVAYLKALIRATLFGAYLATRYSIKDQMRLLTWTLGIAALFSLVAGLALPSYGTHGGTLSSAWKGIFPYKNILGCMMTLAAILFAINILDSRRRRWIHLIGFSMAAVLIFLSQNKMGYSIFLFLLCLLPLYKLTRQHYKLRIVLLIVVLMLGSVLAVLILNNVETIIVQGLGKDMAFNGRQEIWDLAIERGLERPWLGYGYFGFWGSDAGYYIVLNTWGSLQAHDSSFRFNSHNGFIDLFLQLGWVGLSMFIVGYLTLFIRVAIQFYSTGSLESFWMLLTILPELLFNLSDSTSILSSHALWILYVSIGFSTLIQGNRIRKKSQASAALNST